MPSTPENDAFFGRPTVSRGGERSAFPQLRLAVLAESGTHAIVNAALGPYGQGETKLARDLLGSLQANMLCLADRNFFSHALWRDAQQTGANLLWRVKKDLLLPIVEEFPDGSYLSRLYETTYDRQHERHGVHVRVIEYTADDPGRPQAEDRLMTTILGPEAAPANELAALYCERWAIETALDELKTHQRGRMVLRSKTPVRALMHEAAVMADEDSEQGTTGASRVGAARMAAVLVGHANRAAVDTAGG